MRPTSVDSSENGLVTALLVALLVVLVVLVPGVSSAEDALERQDLDEHYHYRWQVSRLAGFFLMFSSLPSEGEGSLSFVHQADGRLRTELLMTSEHSKQGEYWRYGAEIDSQQGRAIRAWSSYRWRGKEKQKADDIEQQGVIDVASGIYLIRKDPPKTIRPMRIWSDGKIYQVEVVPKGTTTRRVGGRAIPVTRYVIRGRDVPNERKWKGHLELWLARDAVSTPVEIRIQRSIVSIRLLLKDAGS